MKSPAASQSFSPLESSTGRGIISFLLFLHLFALGLAWTTNPSWLASRLGSAIKVRVAINQYLYLLWMDVGHNYFFTYGNPNDFDATATVDLVSADRKQTFTIPEPGLVPPLRRERYQNLVNQLANNIDEDPVESLLPAAIAEALLKKTDAESATIECRRTYPRDLSNLQVRETTTETLYKADVKLVNGQRQLLKSAGARDVAPAVQRNPALQPPTTPQTNKPNGSAPRAPLSPLLPPGR